MKSTVAHAYSLSSLRSYEVYIDDQIQHLVNVLNEHATSGKSINMSDCCTIGFMDHGSDFNGMIASQKAVFRYLDIVNDMPILDALLKRNPLNAFLKISSSPFFLYAERAVEQRIVQSKGKSDPGKGKGASPFVHPDLLSSFYPRKRTTPKSSPTSASPITARPTSWPAQQQRVVSRQGYPERMYHEILDTDTSPQKETDGFTALELALKMPLLQAVIEESYRTFGSPTNNLERVISSTGMTLPSSHHLPPGTVFAMNGPSINCHKEVYGADADIYNPLRWMQGENESKEPFRERRLQMGRASLTFGHGSRSLIGKNVVKLEVYKI